MANLLSAIIDNLPLFHIEEPPYSVELELKAPNQEIEYEIRSYGTRIAIETTNDSTAFQRLASYIGVGGDPQNEGSVSISMTAPVAIDMTAPVVTTTTEGEGFMQFILPSEYTSLEDAPIPLSEDVWLKDLAPVKGAVTRFKGCLVMNDKNEEMASMLLEQLEQDLGTELDEDVDVQYWGYNPPFTPRFLRRNEIWVVLTEDQVEELKDTFGSRRMLRYN